MPISRFEDGHIRSVPSTRRAIQPRQARRRSDYPRTVTSAPDNGLRRCKRIHRQRVRNGLLYVAGATTGRIDLGGATVQGGDGLLKERGRLLVVRGTHGAAAGQPGANGVVDVVKLRRHDSRGRVESTVTDAAFAGPSTIARAAKRLLVVNANFAAGPAAPQYTVTGLARNAVRHGHGGRG